MCACIGEVRKYGFAPGMPICAGRGGRTLVGKARKSRFARAASRLAPATMFVASFMAGCSHRDIIADREGVPPGGLEGETASEPKHFEDVPSGRQDRVNFLLDKNTLRLMRKANLAIVCGYNQLVAIKEYLQRTPRELDVERGKSLSEMPAAARFIIYVRAVSEGDLAVSGNGVSGHVARYAQNELEPGTFMMDSGSGRIIISTSIGDIAAVLRIRDDAPAPKHLLMRVSSELIVSYLYSIGLMGKEESEQLINRFYE